MNVALAGVKLPSRKLFYGSGKLKRNQNQPPISNLPSPEPKVTRSLSNSSNEAVVLNTEVTTESGSSKNETTNTENHFEVAKECFRPTLLADTEVQVGNNAEATPISARSIKAYEVRSTKIDWESYLKAQLITQDQFDCIVILSSYSKEKIDHLFTKYGPRCVKFLVDTLVNIWDNQPINSLLVLIDENIITEEDRNRVNIFHECATLQNGSLGWNLFFPFLNRENQFTVIEASRIIAKLVCWSEVLMKQPDLTMYLACLKQQLRSNVNEYKESTTRCIQMLLRIDEYKFAFINADGISAILATLNTGISSQLQYQSVFCLWCCSLKMETASKLHRYKVIPTLAQVLSNANIEKVIRIILATLRNLLEKPEDKELVRENAITMVHNKIVRSLELLNTRKFPDQDIHDDLDYLLEKLETIASEFSSWDEYVAELKSGNFEWSPVHKCETFWKQNVMRFNDNNYEFLRILEVSTDPLILSIVVHDIGQYCRFYPRGKAIIDQLGGKDIAMKLLAHEDPGLQYQALLALQKMMVHNWQFLVRGANQL